MITLANLDYACKETLKAHPDFNMPKIFRELVEKDINLILFTRQGGARDKLTDLTKDDLIIEVLRQAIKVGKLYEYYYDKNRDFVETIPGGALCKDIADLLYKEEKNIILYLKTHPNILSNLASSFAEVRYTKDGYFLGLLVNITTDKADRIISKQFETVKGIENIHIRDEAVNKCKEDILSGSQIKQYRSEYELDGSLYAVSDVGKVRANQEDSVLILTHPDNSEFKMMVVADGMGGAKSGELASQFVVTETMKWFESLAPDYFDHEDALAVEFGKRIHKVSVDLNRKYGNLKCGSTFTGSIIGKNQTVIANVGDSRAYTVMNGEINQITTDHSLVQRMYNAREIHNKDDMRFHKKSNVITASIGMEDPITPTIQTIDNEDYDMLMLFTDGVTDCLSDDQIKIIANSTPKNDIALSMVNMANSNNSSKRIYEDGEYVDKTITGGKDNLTAAVYVRGR